MAQERAHVPHPSRRRRPSGRVITGIVLGILGLIFVFQNTHSGRINVFFWHVTLPSWVWLLILFVVGVIVGSFFPWLRRSARRGRSRSD
jgi:uncharacterized integral membrane protein